MAKLQILPDELDVSLKIMHHKTNPKFKIMKCGSKYYLKINFYFQSITSDSINSNFAFLSNEFLSGGVRLSIIVVLVVIVIVVF